VSELFPDIFGSEEDSGAELHESAVCRLHYRVEPAFSDGDEGRYSVHRQLSRKSYRKIEIQCPDFENHLFWVLGSHGPDCIGVIRRNILFSWDAVHHDQAERKFLPETCAKLHQVWFLLV
jgi:hypothetical protein